MQEDGTATTSHPRTLVIAQDNDKIVQMIRPPHGFGARLIGMADGPIVVAVRRSIAPTIGAANRLNHEP